MSIMNADTTERIHGSRNDRLWDLIQRDWAGNDPQRWKVLACLHLRLHCQWPVETIGRAFGHAGGHILRLVNNGLVELQQTYARARLEEANGVDALLPAQSLAPSRSELDRRIDCCREELDIWQQLREEQLHQELWGESARITRQVVPGSLREQVAECIEEHGPQRSDRIADRLRAAPSKVRYVLWNSPEFSCDEVAVWSVQRFAGQAIVGPDAEITE